MNIKAFMLVPLWVCSVFGTAGARAEEWSDQQIAAKLVGSWRITDANRDGEPSQVHDGVVTIKHITPTGFIWLSYRPDDRQVFRSMGGSWKVEDGRYIETALYGMKDNFPIDKLGQVIPIDVDIQDDVLTQTITSKQGSKFIEVWSRIQSGEDPAPAKLSD